MLSLDRLLALFDEAEPSRRRELAGWQAAAAMHDWLDHVLGESRPDRRRQAVQALFTEDCLLVTPGQGLRGRPAIALWVERLLSRHPEWTFAPTGVAAAHNDMACLSWTFGPPHCPSSAVGTDFALIEGERIRALYRFPKPPAPIRPEDA